jgi:hypothetical protein
LGAALPTGIRARCLVAARSASNAGGSLTSLLLKQKADYRSSGFTFCPLL